MAYCLMHTGKPEHSGRYRWGSGKRPFQRLEGKVGGRGTTIDGEYREAKGSGESNGGSGSKSNWKDEFFRQNIKGGKDKPNQSRAEVVSKNVGKSIEALEDTRRAMQNASDRKKRGKSSINMSDTELRNVINRLEMEKRYENLTKPETNKGYLVAQDILSYAATGVTIAAAAASIASNIYTMKHPNN